MDEADYELLPHQVLNDLKQDVDLLKKRLSQPDARMNELLLEIENLKDHVSELNAIFQKVLDGTKTDDPTKLLKTIAEKFEAVISQNETIARGMIAISDKLEDFMGRSGSFGATLPKGGPSPYPVQHTMGVPPGAGPGRLAPRLAMSSSGGEMGSNQQAPPNLMPSLPPQPMTMPLNESSLDDFDLPPPPPSPGGKKRMGVFR